MDDTKRVVIGLLVVALLGGALLTKLHSSDSAAATQQSIADTQEATTPPEVQPASASAPPEAISPEEARRRQIYLVRSQTVYLAAAHFPGVSTDPKPQDDYQDRLLSQIDRRYGISEAEGVAIDNEGATKMWPIMGADGTISQPH